MKLESEGAGERLNLIATELWAELQSVTVLRAFNNEGYRLRDRW